MKALNLCIIKPNKSSFSETFVQEHIDRLPGNKKVLYGGAFPLYDDEGKLLIRSKLKLLFYLIQKKVLRKLDISVRNTALKDYLLQQNIDVVFAEYGMVGAMVTEACKMAQVPLVIHFHGADAHHEPTVKKYIRFYKSAFEYASAIVAVSNEMVKTLINLGAPPGKLVNASCGVDTTKFPQIDISKSAKNFLSVGRFVEKKSPISVVKAFEILSKKVPDAKLWMVGGGPLYDEVKNYIQQHDLTGRITLTGILKSAEVRNLMHRSRCFVQHSVTSATGDKEGTPVTILEAGSTGLAIVSTLHAGIMEAVIDKETGYLVPEHAIDEMADYMIKFALDVNLASEMGRKEAVHIRKHYDIRDRITTLTRILEKAIKR